MLPLAQDQTSTLQALAARLRAHAAQTAIEHYRRKFESVAAELEKAALQIESRTQARNSVKLASSGS